MKKILLLMCIALAIGCKNTNDTPPKQKDNVKSTNVDCDYLKNNLTGKLIPEQVAWLRTNEADICKKYLKCVEGYHTVSETVYNDAISAQWPTNKPDDTKILLKKLLFDCNYGKYLKFTSDHDIITFEETEEFSTDYTCYSKLLFQSILANHPNLDPDTTNVQFNVGKIKGDIYIIFKIDGISTGFFDFSRIPPITEIPVAI